MLIYHHSQDLNYRRPFGAAEVSSRVSIALDATDTAAVTLRLWRDGVGETRRRVLALRQKLRRLRRVACCGTIF